MTTAAGQAAEAAVLAAIRDPIVVVDKHGEAVYLNAAAAAIFPERFSDEIAAQVRALENVPARISFDRWVIEVLPAENGRVLHFREAECGGPAGHEDAAIQLQHHKEFIEAVLENIESGIVACDENGTLKVFNRATREMHAILEKELPPEEWASHYDLYYPDGKTVLQKQDVPLYRAFCGETVRNAEMVIAPKSSPPRTVLASGRALYAADGRKLGAVVAMHDVTHRKVANRRVSEALRQFRTLFNDAPVAYHEVDVQGVLRRVNRAECRLLGYKREEMMGRPVWDFVAEYLRETSRTAVMEKLAGVRATEVMEREYRTSDGTLLTCELHENLIRDTEGRITGIRTALLNVTDRKRAEQQERTLVRAIIAREQAEAASAEILGILERIGDAYMAFDKEWRYTYVNQKAAHFAKKPASALLGRCVWDEFPEAVHTAFYSELQRSMREQISIDFENYYAPLGKWFENTVYPSPSGVSVFYRDITERKRTRESLERTAAELARKNAELETFAYVASHDLQEPLRMIAGFSGLLGKRYSGVLDADAEGFLRQITDGAHRLQRLIRDLLQLSRTGNAEQGRLSQVSATAALRAARENLSAAIAESGAVLEIDELPVVQGNETHLVQVFQNLISNAIKYRGETSPRITIAAERQDTCWRFSVRDNGRGFDMKYAEQVFLPFKRLHRDVDSGSGIGLAICKKIVEGRGGRMWAESAPGAGSAFYFTIPDELAAE